MMRKIIFYKVWFLFLLTACQVSQSTYQEQEVKVKPSVIYGQDDRLDFYQVQSPQWQERARSTVALINNNKLLPVVNGFQIKTANYGVSQNLCSSEPFFEQVTAAFCSGSLIAPDIIMTAGHCIRSPTACKNTQFVFNFAYQSFAQDPTFVGRDDVYSCQKLIHSELNSSNLSDYALIRLDRPVVGRSPLPIRQAGEVAEGDSLVVIGHPSGLATKFADNAFVRSANPEKYFIANLDTYGGNSGSAVFSHQTGLIEGILVRGETDFKYKNGCYVSNICDDDKCRGEDVTRVIEILNHVDVQELAPIPQDEPTQAQEITQGE
jgi:hypothetical protein